MARRALPSECAWQPLSWGMSTPPMMRGSPGSRRCRSKPWPTRKGSTGVPVLELSWAATPSAAPGLPCTVPAAAADALTRRGHGLELHLLALASEHLRGLRARHRVGHWALAQSKRALSSVKGRDGGNQGRVQRTGLVRGAMRRGLEFPKRDGARRRRIRTSDGALPSRPAAFERRPAGSPVAPAGQPCLATNWIPALHHGPPTVGSLGAAGRRLRRARQGSL